MSTLIPTQAQVEASEEYALEQMCTAIMKPYGTDLTLWDKKMKACRVTRLGCAPGPQNPLSRMTVDTSGNVIDIEAREQNKEFVDFWKDRWVPDMYVWKTITGSNEPVCARANSLLYRWCQYPQTRIGDEGYGSAGKGYTDVPPFTYAVRDGVETCIIGADYCKNRGVDYDNTPGNEHCYVSEEQKVGEFFASEVLVRYANRSE